jgi:hypothetical protein
VYLLPTFEGGVILLGTVTSLWQGILLWTSEPEGTQTLEPGQA